MADVREKDRESRDKYGYDNFNKYDDPPNSRLFIVCNKNITEDDFRTAFSKYGTIDEIWVVKDRNTQEPKGVTYIKFSKTSEAALALEEMNGECIGTYPRPLKVMIAHSRDQGSKREMNEEERLLRLFCVVPKAFTDKMLRDHFQQFGDIDYVSVVKDRETKESKGFAYVKYHRVSHAAKAFEGCDRSFRAVFAEPKRQNKVMSFDSGYERFNTGQPPSVGSQWNDTPFLEGNGTSFGGQCPDGGPTLRVIASPSLNQDQLWRLFDLIPGLDYLSLDNKSRMGKGQALVVYNSVQSAQYAREKLHGFEYPPGQRLIVKAEPGGGGGGDHSLSPHQMGRGNVAMRGPPPAGLGGPRQGGIQAAELATLADQLARQASSLMQAAGLGTGGNSVRNTNAPQQYDPSYCSVKLPPQQPLAGMESETAERLFIVCHHGPPPTYAMRDVFSRFGDLIDVYMLSGKNCGYAKYANKESAERAIQALHGQEILGVRLKVMAADPRNDDRRKRLRIDDQ